MSYGPVRAQNTHMQVMRFSLPLSDVSAVLFHLCSDASLHLRIELALVEKVFQGEKVILKDQRIWRDLSV